MSNTFELLIPIFKDIFDDEDLVLTQSTTAMDIDGWDSLTHISLVVAIEKFFDLRFTAAEISNLENVGQMADLVSIKQKKI
tara:strand:+ start:753 stop:995 length:243 start_codon:yes stop_codon:yes gene_type:complete